MEFRNRGIICMLLLIILWILIYRSRIIDDIEGFDSNNDTINGLKFKSIVINLDKDQIRYTKFLKYYQESDIYTHKINRYSAIVGKNENAEELLTDDAQNEFKHVLQNGYITHHHQLTYGGIGCFMSHYNLAKQLLTESSDTDIYLIFEDDTSIPKNMLMYIQEHMKSVPNDWDIVLFYTIHAVGHSQNEMFNKIKSFWGMNSYIINKKGAKKLVDEVDAHKIDGQIDSYLSRMVQQNKINIYTTKKHIVSPHSTDTNIQIALKPLRNVNPFNFKGYII